ncbi:hypothetical protein DUNSADRAFT_11371 [Dunaliella salina]|uniref:Secreted protein n=1 Tax=Dunaliella salina TaxID=3046 RepID=A0ABQ7GDK6_DUNSA|nr:hypothetical protein DUNSADRAFT_11371 [Dunaliella salina]|eukprot:KAF5832690.1 hypothetical protein DUNSADRAFT_11371 [Dunaliella salina]
MKLRLLLLLLLVQLHPMEHTSLYQPLLSMNVGGEVACFFCGLICTLKVLPLSLSFMLSPVRQVCMIKTQSVAERV